MRKFWKIYKWIYLGVVIYGIFYYIINPIGIASGTSRLSYVIAYIMVSLMSFFPVYALFLHSAKKRRFILFWRVYFFYFAYNIFDMLIKIFQSNKISTLLPFHIIALIGIYQYCFMQENRERSKKRHPIRQKIG